VAGSRLFRATDRGDTWEERPLPRRSPSGPSLVNAEISFVNEREGWLSSVGPPATQCTFQGVAIWHTADAGSTWELVTTTGIADAQCKHDVSFADALHGFISAGDVIYRTSDGGRGWSASRPLPDPPGFTTQPGGSLQAGRVHAFGPTLLLAAGGQSGGRFLTYVFRSPDGGASWSYATTIGMWHGYASDYSQAAGVAPSIIFGDADVGYATVRGGIQRSVDGGAHWSFIRTPGTG